MSMSAHTANSKNPLLIRLNSLVASAGLGRNALYSLGEYAVVPILYLAATPYLIRHLGLDVYGIWMLINSMIGLAGALDLGLGDATIRFVALNRARESRAGIIQAINVAFVATIPVSVAASLALFSLAPRFVERLFTIPPDLSPATIQSVRIGAILLVIRMTESILE